MLSIVLSLSKNRPVYFSKHNVSETGFCLRVQVKPIQLGLIDRASPYLLFLDKDTTINNVQKHNICTFNLDLSSFQRVL
jgi:hypothetical protein